MEIKAGDFGQGPLDTLTYPISQPEVRDPVTPVVKQTCGQGASTSGRSSRILAFELPENVMTDDEIKEISTDVSVFFFFIYIFSYYLFICTKVTLFVH